MSRILITLSSFSLIVMGAALLLGLSVGDLYQSPDESTLRMATAHRLTGTAAALTVVFVECLVVTYFVGTSRWCCEVVETYGLAPEPIAASQKLKRRTFPWALMGMLVVVGVGAMGAAGDPATGRLNTQWWTQIHLASAMLGWMFIAWTYYVIWNRVQENQEIIGGILEDVARVRKERGLE